MTSLAQNTNQKTAVILTPPKGWRFPDLAEIWGYRELLYYLTWRDIKVRYKQTVLGVGWALIHPIVNILIFSFLMGGLAKLPSEGVPYAVFACAGLVPWGFFSRAMTAAGGSLLGGAAISAKVYFPRMILTISAVLSSLVDSFLAFLVMFGLMFWFRISPNWNSLVIPLFLLLAVFAAMALGVWLAALSVQYRDVAQLSGLLITFWMYASPVVYSPTLLPDSWFGKLYWLNPMAIVIQGFRWGLLESSAPPLVPAILSILGVLGTLITGLLYFHRVEQTFIDLV